MEKGKDPYSNIAFFLGMGQRRQKEQDHKYALVTLILVRTAHVPCSLIRLVHNYMLLSSDDGGF